MGMKSFSIAEPQQGVRIPVIHSRTRGCFLKRKPAKSRITGAEGI